jgi:hypothetical protein
MQNLTNATWAVNATEWPVPTTLPPVQLVSPEVALAIGASVFVAFVAVGLIVLVGCVCQLPSTPKFDREDDGGPRWHESCSRMLPCRFGSFMCLWCYAKCCRRSSRYASRYASRLMDRAHNAMDSLENDLAVEMQPVNGRPTERLLSDEEGGDEWGDWTDIKENATANGA